MLVGHLADKHFKPNVTVATKEEKQLMELALWALRAGI